MAIRAVVFDLGGVLEHEIDTGKNARWEALLDLRPGEYRERLFSSGLLINATYGKFSEEEMLQEYKKVYGLKQEQMDKFMHDLWNEYCGELNAELAEYFKGLRPRYQTAILSNAIPGARREECKRHHFDEMSDLIIYSYEEQTAKPDSCLYAIVCERLDRRPEEIIFLDNTQRIVETAREFGFHAILFESTGQAIAEIEVIANQIK